MRLFLALSLMSCAIIAAEESPLQPVDRPVIAGEMRCPPYFVRTTFGGAVAPQIVFVYRTPDGSMKGDSIPKERTRVKISEGQAPTYEKTSVDGGKEGALFRLSQADYEKARDCLPEPQATR